MQVIEVPGMGDVEFPDDMSDEEITAAIQKNMGSRGSKSSAGSFLKNVAGALPETILSMGSGVLAEPVAGIGGLAAAGANRFLDNKISPASVVDDIRQKLTYQPRTDYARRIGEGAAVPLEKLAQAADAAGDVAARPSSTRISGMAANYGLDPIRKQADDYSPLAGTVVNTAIQSAPALLLRGRSGGMAGDVPPRVSPRGSGLAAGERPAASASSAPAGRSAGLERIPSKDELKAAAEAAYKRADQSGVVVTRDSFSSLKSRIADEMKKDGIDSTLHPDSSAALKRITDADGELSLQNLETLRRIANDAEGSIKPADRRLAGKMVDEIDDYIDSLAEKDVVAGDAAKAKALKEARNLYSRRMKAEELDKLMGRAELSAPNFSASGMENAIRTEFRNLAKNERKMRRFTKEEQEAIKRVAKGGPVENTLRMLGKFAPTGTVSTGLSAGTGFLAGGPMGAIALPAAGVMGRYLASRLTAKNAARANEIARRGPMLPEPAPPGGLVPTVSPEQGMLGY
jgi:hypothetical protein